MLSSTLKNKKINICIGYDSNEFVALYTAIHSIFKYATQPVCVTPVALHHMSVIHNRAWHPKQSNQFSFSRWLAPYLHNYKGWAIWLDCDVMLTDDISKLWALRDDNYAVQVVKHLHIPTENTKYLGMPQTAYDKKNWSSVMLFNNQKCKALTSAYANTASGLDLHQFKWLKNDMLIGGLPPEWNHLVGVHPHNPQAKIVHFTLGGPYFNETKNCCYAHEWRTMYLDMIRCTQKGGK